MAGYDGHRGWLYALAVDPDQRRRGIAKALVDEAITRLRALGCTKVNLQVRAGNDTADRLLARRWASPSKSASAWAVACSGLPK